MEVSIDVELFTFDWAVDLLGIGFDADLVGMIRVVTFAAVSSDLRGYTMPILPGFGTGEFRSLFVSTSRSLSG